MSPERTITELSCFVIRRCLLESFFCSFLISGCISYLTGGRNSTDLRVEELWLTREQAAAAAAAATAAAAAAKLSRIYEYRRLCLLWAWNTDETDKQTDKRTWTWATETVSWPSRFLEILAGKDPRAQSSWLPRLYFWGWIFDHFNSKKNKLMLKVSQEN